MVHQNHWRAIVGSIPVANANKHKETYKENYFSNSGPPDFIFLESEAIGK
ncbi:MAG TPA: hypothetical protein VFG90_00560 [Nitrososphaeraceae archaeon]|nr:hypothetical protein [Nitrososphaeraceae archaeon]